MQLTLGSVHYAEPSQSPHIIKRTFVAKTLQNLPNLVALGVAYKSVSNGKKCHNGCASYAN